MPHFRLIVAAAVSVTAVAFPARPAFADQTCELDPVAGQIRCVNGQPGGSNGSDDRPTSTSSLGTWTLWTNNAVFETVDQCPVDPVTGVIPGHSWLQFTPANDPTNTEIVDSWCPPRIVELPPPPPTAEEIRGLAAAPVPEINLAPASRGVTGVPTRLWSGSDAPIAVGPLTLRGWSVTGTATPTSWTWETGTGQTLSSSHAGTSESPAATYTYETKGTFIVETSVSYSGDFIVLGPYGVTVSATIGAIDVTTTQPYDVVEVRSARD